MVNDRYKVALAISLRLKASSIFPDREFRLKNGPKSEFLGKSEISGKSGIFLKIVVFLFSMCFEHKNTLCVQISPKNIAISIYKGLTMKKWSQFDDAIRGHVRGPRFENLLFSCS